MKKIFLLFSITIITIIFGTFASCSKNNEDVIVFDDTQPLALAPDVEWAVVIDPYAAYKENYGWQEDVKGHCRKGDILQILGKSIDSANEYWYCFEDGWLPASCLAVYSNRYKAQSVSKSLLNANK